MELIKTAYIHATHKYRLELDEALAADCEKYLKDIAVNPETVPPISMQTLAQCWTSELGYGLAEYKIDIKGYNSTKTYSCYLHELIKEFLDDEVWDADYEEWASDIDDCEDDLDCSDDMYRNVVCGTNPDFPDLREGYNAN